VIANPITYLLDQLRPVPDAGAVEADEARAYANVELLDAYGGLCHEGLFDTEETLARRHFTAGMHVLDVGCGTGREALGFASLGLRVTGIDVCADAISRARRAAEVHPSGERVDFRVMGLSELAFADKTFDAVFLSSDVYASIPGRARRVAMLRKCRRLMRPNGNGLVVLPAMVGTGLLARLVVDMPRRIARRHLGDRVAEPGDRWLRRPHEGTLAPRFRHVFASERLVRSEIEDARLTVIDRVSCYWVVRPSCGLYRMRDDVRTHEANGEAIVTQISTGDVFSLNKTATAIWAHARRGLTVREIAEQIAASRAPLNNVEGDAEELLESMVDAGLVRREPGPTLEESRP
jgi:SAM-dependent methyltransferase